MPHQDISLDKVLSDSGQDCVDLSPIENYNFGQGPNFIESPSSLVQMFYDPNFIESPSSLVLMFSDLQRKLTCCSHAQDASPQHWAPQRSFLLRSRLVDLSLVENYNFGWGPKFVRSPSSLLQMFYDLQRKKDCMLFQSCASCLTRTLVSIRFFLTQVKTVQI